MCGHQSPKSACVSALSDQGLHFLLTELLDTIGGMNEEQMPGWDFAYDGMNLNLCILRMLEDTFSCGTARIMAILT